FTSKLIKLTEPIQTEVFQLNLFSKFLSYPRQVSDVLDRIEFCDFRRLHIAEAVRAKPPRRKFRVVSRVKKLAALIFRQRNRFAILVAARARNQVSKFTVDGFAVNASAHDAAVDVLIYLSTVHQGCRKVGNIGEGCLSR